MKKEPYTSVNPNGRVPAIEDPNTGITLWESSAIYDYLLETYDKNGSLHFKTGHEKFFQKSWMAFQISGQGPYYGQRAWFLVVRQLHVRQRMHQSDAIVSTTVRRSNPPLTATAMSMSSRLHLWIVGISQSCRVHRVLSVINDQLRKSGKPYLVGDKCTYADLAFVTWHWTLLFPPHFMGAEFGKE